MVVVETVWVVVVVVYTPWSPTLPSDLDDSDNLEGKTGNANVEFVSSPYAGGPLVSRDRSCCSKVIRDARASSFPWLRSLLDFLFESDTRGLVESDPGGSGVLRRRGKVNVDFFFWVLSKGSTTGAVGAVVMIAGAI